MTFFLVSRRLLAIIVLRMSLHIKEEKIKESPPPPPMFALSIKHCRAESQRKR